MQAYKPSSRLLDDLLQVEYIEDAAISFNKIVFRF